MRGGGTQGGRDEPSPGCTPQLEELVRTVAALDGPRAVEMLSGLSSPIRPRALELLGQLERGSRAERHARLATVFGRRSPPSADPGAVPGRLGMLLRAQLDGLGAGNRSTDAGSLARWARRLLAELDGAV